MSLKYTCDMCNKEVEKYVRVGRDLTMYCEKCWMDKKNWKKIHEEATRDSNFR